MTNARFYLGPNIPHVTWFKELDPFNITGNIEYSYFLKNVYKKNVEAIGLQDAQDYFSLAVNPKSFMNPVNIKSFLDNYEDNNYTPIIKRFNL